MLSNLYASFVNLDSRPDRLAHMNEQIKRVNLPITRTRGIPWREVEANREDIDVMLKRTPGAIGCHFSQMSVVREAYNQKKHALVLEDDVIFCEDINLRLEYIDLWADKNDWDIIWLGASFHVNPPFWHPQGYSKMSPNCSANLGYDAKVTDDPHMIRTYGAFCTFAYIVNYKSMDKIFALFDRHLKTSIGIDWLYIKLQPQLKCFSFVPGCTRQMDNRSDIGNGDTIWSGFLKLNGTYENSAYVYQERMTDFDPTKFNWNEAN